MISSLEGHTMTKLSLPPEVWRFVAPCLVAAAITLGLRGAEPVDEPERQTFVRNTRGLPAG